MAKQVIEERLWNKARQAIQELQGLRKPQLYDIFSQRYYISPQDLFITNYPRTQPAAAFNPGALLRDDKLLVFPRLVFDYYLYVSSIGVFQLDIEAVLAGRIAEGGPLQTRIILWPHALWELGHGCEDPRVISVDDSIYMLYTGAGQHHEGRHPVRRSILGFAELDLSFEIRRRGYFSVAGDNEGRDGNERDERFIASNKDSTFLEIRGDRATMLTRPDLRRIALCWRAQADLRALTIAEGTLEPVMAFEAWEEKVGWSTNVVRLAADEYLVGWHAVLREDLSYKNGLALVNGKGELLAISDYLLAPQGLAENYGDRPFVIFGDGLVLYKDYLIWIGGISDYGIGIFITELDRALEQLRRIK